MKRKTYIIHMQVQNIFNNQIAVFGLCLFLPMVHVLALVHTCYRSPRHVGAGTSSDLVVCSWGCLGHTSMARHLTRTGPIGRTPAIPTYLANQKSQKENQAPEEHHALARGEGKLPVIEISYSYMEKNMVKNPYVRHSGLFVLMNM